MAVLAISLFVPQPQQTSKFVPYGGNPPCGCLQVYWLLAWWLILSKSSIISMDNKLSFINKRSDNEDPLFSIIVPWCRCITKFWLGKASIANAALKGSSEKKNMQKVTSVSRFAWFLSIWKMVDKVDCSSLYQDWKTGKLKVGTIAIVLCTTLS